MTGTPSPQQIAILLLDQFSVISWLKRLARQGTILGAVETGTWLLAKAGLLNGYRATIHWENRAKEHLGVSPQRFTFSSGFARVYRRTFGQSPHRDGAAVYSLDQV